MSRAVPPSIKETAFSCPHCSAFTTQDWYGLHAKEITGDTPVPFIAGEEQKELIRRDQNIPAETRKELIGWFDKLNAGFVLLHTGDSSYVSDRVHNLHLSKCYNCKKIAVWIHDRLVFPLSKSGVAPNPDLPDSVLADFEEAREIANASPRGAAALLRLCVQKLCKHLGERGKNIDEDIATLVRKGLNPLVQQSLDIVRVIGNEAVHPGVIDLKDDRDTALRLFELINSIADQMISHPKAISEMYSKLPESKRKAIEDRDKKSTTP